MSPLLRRICTPLGIQGVVWQDSIVSKPTMLVTTPSAAIRDDARPVHSLSTSDLLNSMAVLPLQARRCPWNLVAMTWCTIGVSATRHLSRWTTTSTCSRHTTAADCDSLRTERTCSQSCARRSSAVSPPSCPDSGCSHAHEQDDRVAHADQGRCVHKVEQRH